jgi:Skp family chaperone for outer membrane proteins
MMARPRQKKELNENCNVYIRARTEYSKEKKERRQRFYMTQREERDELRDRQKLERQALFESLGRGVKRQDINPQRSVLATKHAYESAV